MTSGSLFVRGGRGWTGRLDVGEPDATSTTATNSTVFRLVSRRSDLRDVSVSFALERHRCASTAATPSTSWNGVHVFLRYQSAQHLYYASVDRCDGALVLKKKVPGGPSNGGTYHTLAELRRAPAPAGTVRAVSAEVRNRPDGSVQLSILGSGGTVLLTAVDRGTGGAPIAAPGRIGIRADNTEFSVDDLVVRSVR
jgi:hypothetical protein